jgi:hypothetical protein
MKSDPRPPVLPLAWRLEREGAPSSSAGGLVGEVVFASPEAQVQRTSELLGEGAIVVTVPPLAADRRGRLGELVEEHVERELAARGAPAPYLAAWSGAGGDDAETRLSEQLFRARTLGASGIAIAMGSLSAAATPALAPEDGAVLRTLARAAAAAPIVLMLDDADAVLTGYADPVSITVLLAGAAPIVTLHDTTVDAPVEPVTARTEAPPSPPDIAEALATMEDDDFEPEPEPARTRTRAPVEGTPRGRAAVAGVPVAGPDAAPTGAASPSEATGRAPPTGVARADREDVWRTWAGNLASARGPQPLSAFQRLFVESYMPLAYAIADGLDDPRALRAYDEFRRAFERAYADAFATFGVTNRRPRLVMDAHDWATKQARLHNARAAHVLVVDSLRCDLAWLVRDALAARAAGHLSLTSETILFAALPSTTLRQLETIARGMDALRAPAAADGTESLRGRAAEMVRRMRVGSRELYKLDLVPTMLGPLDAPARGGSEQVVAAFEEIADAVADALARHVETLAPRTLLLVTGDHGFCLDRRGRITHGGASPEEVLVPALAYLVGELH